MKTIKIFLASSEELKDERLEMTDLVSRLNQTFKGRGIQLELKRWEYLDSSMGDQRKQDEYNNVLRECDICLVLFWRKFGEYTQSEFLAALRSARSGGSVRRLAVLFKETGEAPSPDLADFRRNCAALYGVEPGSFSSDAELRARFLSLVFDLLRDVHPGFPVPGNDTLARYGLR